MTRSSSPSSSSIRVPFLRLHPRLPQDKSALPPSPSAVRFVSKSDFDDAYAPFQALHIRGGAPLPSKGSARKFRACDARTLFESLNNQDKASWCIENETKNEEASTTPPRDFLDVNNKNHTGYCSFLVQHSKTVMNDLISNRLPLIHLPVESGTENAKDGVAMKVRYGPCLWLFFGKNGSSSSKHPPATLEGRPEHTDSVTHDGTWHYQLSGTKIWRLRPTTQLMRRIKEQTQHNGSEPPLSGAKRSIDDANGHCNPERVEDNVFNYCDERGKRYIEVECKEGDVLLLNTELWWHSTLIPPQDVPCISYARDIYLPSTDAAAAATAATVDACHVEEKDGPQLDQEQPSMANIDGTYAAEDIEAETVLFSEHTMPECELPRSQTNPNCQVVELEDEETGEMYMAVVSLRDIKAGEFFCMLESDEEEEDDSEAEVEEWEDGDSEDE